MAVVSTIDLVVKHWDSAIFVVHINAVNPVELRVVAVRPVTCELQPRYLPAELPSSIVSYTGWRMA